MFKYIESQRNYTAASFAINQLLQVDAHLAILICTLEIQGHRPRSRKKNIITSPFWCSRTCNVFIHAMLTIAALYIDRASSTPQHAQLARGIPRVGKASINAN